MSDRSIQEAIQKLAGTHLKDNIHLVTATIKSVDQMTRTCVCTPIGGSAVTDIIGVQLMAEINDGLLIMPLIDSTVLVLFSTRNIPYVIGYGGLDKYFLTTASGIQFQGGEFGGLVKVIELTAKINKLEAAFNALNAKVNALAPTPVIPPITPTNATEITNNFITHGGL
ncbi:hypothetical protein [Mucilaginibacter sp. 10I4]|uniref:hypothetical protein n=1 Tax=Mucilaginibacter sp. 10I4 TaxID=3048580 RepID=UPI002B22744A|nr:hypothetical protein [Mucilaginibacter sp. 10I4]MEB0262294.1 hypothetical protein [Mucilaginibacter sp. 10I4]